MSDLDNNIKKLQEKMYEAEQKLAKAKTKQARVNLMAIIKTLQENPLEMINKTLCIKDNKTIDRIGEVWQHGYHDSIPLDEDNQINLVCDDMEYSIVSFKYDKENSFIINFLQENQINVKYSNPHLEHYRKIFEKAKIEDKEMIKALGDLIIKE